MSVAATPPPTTPDSTAAASGRAFRRSSFWPDRARARSGARRTGAAGLGALMALGTLPVVTGLATSAGAAVTIGTNISIFPDRDMVVAVGYEEGQELLVEVLRNDVVIGYTRGPAVETPEGIGLEVNHGPLGAPLPGDCWTGFTPDIVGGDVIRVTPAGSAVSDTATVVDVAFSGAPVENADGTVSVSGTADPTADFAVEFRRDKPDPRFRRGPFVPVFEAGTNNWTATFRPTATSAEGLSAAQQRSIALNEASWLAVADNITETTLAELGEPGGVGPGCVGSADPNSIAGGLQPYNIASTDVTFSGTTRAGVTGVRLTVGGVERPAVVTPGANGGPGTWTLTIADADFSALPDGNVAVTPRFDTTIPDPTDPTLPGTTTTAVGATRTVLKDTVAPLAPNPSVAPGTYSAAQAVALNKPAGEGPSKVYWEIGNTAVPAPDQFSNLYNGTQIQVTSNQTITARLYDAAGNAGAVGTFAYRIGNPPAAPAGLTATESTTAAGTANLRWTGVTGVSGYNVYRGGIKVNTATITGTTFADTAAGLGDFDYVVRALDANGIESLDSNRVLLTIAAPGIPTGLRATEGDARVTLNWSAVAGASNYRIYRDGVVVSSAVAGTSYINAGLTNGTLYEYSIAALDAGGNESPRTGIVQAVPQVPVDRTAPPAPTMSVASGTYTAAQSVTMANSEVGAVIRYTVGTGTTVPADPDASSAQYTGAIPVNSSQVIKAAAFDAAGNRSLITQRNYTINLAAPNTAPTVTTRSPGSGATGVAIGSNVTATFNEAVQGVSNTTFTLRNSAGAAITAPVTYDATTRVATLNPGVDLAAGTTYTATLTGGSTAIRDSANLGLATTSWTFTTAPATTNPAPTVTTRSPGSGATGVAVGSNVTATFSEAVQGVGNTTFTLRSSAGTAITAPVTYNATTRVATLDPSANLAAGTTYTATLTGGSTAIRDTTNLGLATTSWTFTTAPATTTNPAPTLASRAPLPGATGVSRINNITMRFSEAVQGANSTTVTLRPISSTGTLGAVITATVTYNSTTFGVGLDPSVTLAANSRYQVTVTGSTTAIRDLAGAPFASTTWTFTTGA